MLQVSFFELVARGIPESFLFIYLVHLLTHTKINIKKYFISSMLLDVIGFLIRRLPINYGIHTILNIVVVVILVTAINKINILEAIKSTIITSIIVFVCEGINMFLIQILYGNNIANILSNPVLKIIYGMPSLIIFIIVILTIRITIYKKEE